MVGATPIKFVDQKDDSPATALDSVLEPAPKLLKRWRVGHQAAKELLAQATGTRRPKLANQIRQEGLGCVLQTAPPVTASEGAASRVQQGLKRMSVVVFPGVQNSHAETAPSQENLKEPEDRGLARAVAAVDGGPTCRRLLDAPSISSLAARNLWSA